MQMDRCVRLMDVWRCLKRHVELFLAITPENGGTGSEASHPLPHFTHCLTVNTWLFIIKSDLLNKRGLGRSCVKQIYLGGAVTMRTLRNLVTWDGPQISFPGLCLKVTFSSHSWKCSLCHQIDTGLLRWTRIRNLRIEELSDSSRPSGRHTWLVLKFFPLLGRLVQPAKLSALPEVILPRLEYMPSTNPFWMLLCLTM